VELTPEDLLQAMFNPGAPLPASWPPGVMGVFLLFTIFPGGAGIPFGIIMARDAGMLPIVTLALYALSDVVGAVMAEPYVLLLRWLGRKVSWIGAIGRNFTRLTGAAGLAGSGKRGPLGIVLVSFTVSMATARATAAAAGHGPVVGWALAILGDLGYFLVLMASTLWLSAVLGDERMTIGIVLGAMWVLPMLIRKWRERNMPIPAPARTIPVIDEQTAAVSMAPRRKGSRAERKRARFAANSR
jgi:hypothetical protein